MPRPFTAEQIRDEFAPGTVIELTRRTPAGETRQRWTVVAADVGGVSIEYADLDATGHVDGTPKIERSTWVELRDHASFPADRSTREETRRDTALGDLSGWLYTVRDAAAGTVSELFFAASLPGPPVEMRVTKDGKTVFEMTQRVHRKAPS
ncbi:MAG: hypothetical protein U0X73_05605 [Thermoanaerobaculia bacterium]